VARLVIDVALIVVGLVLFAVGTRAMLAHGEWGVRVNPGRYLAMAGGFLIVIGIIGLALR